MVSVLVGELEQRGTCVSAAVWVDSVLSSKQLVATMYSGKGSSSMDSELVLWLAGAAAAIAVTGVLFGLHSSKR